MITFLPLVAAHLEALTKMLPPRDLTPIKPHPVASGHPLLNKERVGEERDGVRYETG